MSILLLKLECLNFFFSKIIKSKQQKGKKRLLEKMKKRNKIWTFLHAQQ